MGSDIQILQTHWPCVHTWCSSDTSVIPFEFTVGLHWQHKLDSAARTPRCREILNKGRREQTLKNTCWPNTKAPYAQLKPHCCLDSLYAHSLPGPHTHTYIYAHTLHWGQASKSNPGLLFCPEHTTTQSTHTTSSETDGRCKVGWRMKEDGEWLAVGKGHDGKV